MKQKQINFRCKNCHDLTNVHLVIIPGYNDELGLVLHCSMEDMERLHCSMREFMTEISREKLRLMGDTDE